MQPSAAYTVAVPYSEIEIAGSAWVKEPTSVLDPETHTVTAHPDHMSTWALMGDEWKQVYIYPVRIEVREERERPGF